MQKSRWIRRPHESLAALLLGAAMVFQLNTLVRDYAAPWSRRALQEWGAPAWKRTALFLEGMEFSDYIGFLRERIPEDGRVILPPRRPLGAFSYVSYIQYFLFPRDVHNCGVNEVEECIRRVQGSKTYILAVDDFPPVELASEHKRLIPFNDHLGVFAPK